MKLFTLPEDGVTSVLSALRQARKTIDLTIFRFDRKDLEKAIAAAIDRGVVVRALIAHTNSSSESLRKLELRLLELGATVARTASDLARYHYKILVIDRKVAHVNGFNFTHLDIDRSRSFGLAFSDRALVQEILRLFEADFVRQEYRPTHKRLVVSPFNSRERLAAFLRGARRDLVIYDAQLRDLAMIRLLQERAKKGVRIRVIGKMNAAVPGIELVAPEKRLHVRAIVRDGSQAFIGSQSLRALELDGRREVGVIIRARPIVKRLEEIFESDWQSSLVYSEQVVPLLEPDQVVAAAG